MLLTMLGMPALGARALSAFGWGAPLWNLAIDSQGLAAVAVVLLLPIGTG